MKGRPPITTDLRFIIGGLFCYTNRRITFDTGGKSDYAFTIENYKRDGKVVRLNHYSFSADYSANTDVGNDTDRFMAKYGKFVSKVVTHKNGSTSFVLKKDAEK